MAAASVAAVAAVAVTVLAGCTPATVQDPPTASPAAGPAPTAGVAGGERTASDDRTVAEAPTTTGGESAVAARVLLTSCDQLEDVHGAMLAAAGLGALLDVEEQTSTCTVVGQRGALRVQDAGGTDPGAYLAATGFGSAPLAGDDVLTVVDAGVAAAATRVGGTTLVVRIERTIEGRDEDQAAAVLAIVVGAITD